MIRKLSFMLSIMRLNFEKGTAKESTCSGTDGLANTSNMPNTACGSAAFPSNQGYCAIEAQPAPNGAMTALRSRSSNPDRVKPSGYKIRTIHGIGPQQHPFMNLHFVASSRHRESNLFGSIAQAGASTPFFKGGDDQYLRSGHSSVFFCLRR